MCRAGDPVAPRVQLQVLVMAEFEQQHLRRGLVRLDAQAGEHLLYGRRLCTPGRSSNLEEFGPIAFEPTHSHDCIVRRGEHELPPEL